nr:MAG TPA: hypothetical protein [Caudoviricetes sp.]
MDTEGLNPNVTPADILIIEPFGFRITPTKSPLRGITRDDILVNRREDNTTVTSTATVMRMVGITVPKTHNKVFIGVRVPVVVLSVLQVDPKVTQGLTNLLGSLHGFPIHTFQAFRLDALEHFVEVLKLVFTRQGFKFNIRFHLIISYWLIIAIVFIFRIIRILKGNIIICILGFITFFFIKAIGFSITRRVFHKFNNLNCNKAKTQANTLIRSIVVGCYRKGNTTDTTITQLDSFSNRLSLSIKQGNLHFRSSTILTLNDLVLFELKDQVLTIFRFFKERNLIELLLLFLGESIMFLVKDYRELLHQFRSLRIILRALKLNMIHTFFNKSSISSNNPRIHSNTLGRNISNNFSSHYFNSS